MGFFLEKLIFLNTVEAKVIILTRFVKPNEKIAINKFQRSRLTYDLSAKVAHIGISHQNTGIKFKHSLKHSVLRNHLTN